MVSIGDVKEAAFKFIDQNRGWLSEFHLEIWNYAEPAFREYRSAEAYVRLLRGEGFEVEEGTGGMPTAFMATWGEGRPLLGTYAEYDAVPGHNQKPVPYRAPRDGLHPYAAGHTDPHSALGAAALFGVLAAKHAMERYGIKGSLRIFGEPAEKVCGSKPVHAAKGYYDGADAYISYHPGYANYVRGEIQGGAYWSLLFQFECDDPVDWYKLIAVDPTPYRRGWHSGGRVPAALDAVCLMYMMTKMAKEAMLPHTAYWTLNEFIMVGGQCTSDNLPPKISQIQYAYRSPTLTMQERITRVLENNARAAARMAFCEVYERWITKTRVGLPNLVMAEVTYENLKLVGPPRYGEEAKRFAREIQRSLGYEPMAEPFLEHGLTYGGGEAEKPILSPREMDELIRRAHPAWVRNMGSDDYVEYTWHAPTSRFFTARPVLKPLPDGRPYPWWVHVAMGGNPCTIDPCIITAAKTIAATFIDLLMKPEILRRAWSEFDERTGGGIGGSKWVSPLLPRDFEPPIDLRWPEYVSTPRGEEWWIPTPKSRGEFKPL